MTILKYVTKLFLTHLVPTAGTGSHARVHTKNTYRNLHIHSLAHNRKRLRRLVRKALTLVYATRRHYAPRIVQFEAAFGESSRQPASGPITEPLSFYAHIWQEL